MLWIFYWRCEKEENVFVYWLPVSDFVYKLNGLFMGTEITTSMKTSRLNIEGQGTQNSMKTAIVPD